MRRTIDYSLKQIAMNDKLKMIVRLPLGLILVAFGVNKFAGFMPMPEMQEVAMNFAGALGETGYMYPFIGIIEIISGLMLLLNKNVPFALILFAPVLLNILLFHLVLDPASIMFGAIVGILWIILCFAYKDRIMNLMKS